MRVVWEPGDLQRTRFCYSPLVEVAESLWLYNSGRNTVPHQWWLRSARRRGLGPDGPLLEALAPARSTMAEFLFGGLDHGRTGLSAQLEWLSRLSADRLGGDLDEVWPEGLPRVLAQLLDCPEPGGRVAEALERYWRVALEPSWGLIRGVLEQDVAYRASVLAADGFGDMLRGLHERVRVQTAAVEVGSGGNVVELRLRGRGLVLIPSVFAWPWVACNYAHEPSVVYGARSIGRLSGEPPSRDGRATLHALLGRTRAEVLVACQLPTTTTELAVQLGQSPGTISQHLSVLRDSALLHSWRSGRRVIYARTSLGDSVVEARTADQLSPASAERLG